MATDVPQFGVPQPTAGRRFGFSGNYEMIGGDLPFGVRKSIYKLGLKPQSFFDVDAITQVVADGVTQALTREF